MDPKRKTDGTSVTVEEHYNDRDVKRIKTSVSSAIILFNANAQVYVEHGLSCCDKKSAMFRTQVARRPLNLSRACSSQPHRASQLY